MNMFKGTRTGFLCLVCSAGFAVLMTWAAPARAYTANQFQFSIGDAGFGFAGAFAAQADDATAGWYNPGGLGLLYNSYFNASGNAYYWEDTREPAYLRFYSPTKQQRRSGELAYKQIAATPTSLAYAVSLTGKAHINHVLAFGLYVPRYFSIDSTLKLDSKDISNIRAVLNSKSEMTGRTIVGGPSYALGVGDVFGIGLSMMVMYHNGHTASENEFSAYDQSGNMLFSKLENVRDTVNFWGMYFNLGMKTKISGFHGGLSIRTPRIRFYESIKGSSLALVASNISGTPNQRIPADYDIEVDPGEAMDNSWRIRAGVAWKEPKVFAVEFDFIYDVFAGKYPALKTDASGNPTGVKEIDTPEENVWNIAVGAEVYLIEALVLRMGFFTDNSTNSAPPRDIAAADYGRYLLPHFNIYGGTMALSMFTDNEPGNTKSLSIGVRYSRGEGDGMGTTIDMDSMNQYYVRRNMVYQNVTLTLGGTVSF